MINLSRALLFALTTLALMIAVNTAADNGANATARAAAIDWLSLVDAGEYEASWEQASPTFRGQVTPSQWRDAAEQARKPLGSLITRELTSAQYKSVLPGVPAGDYVIFSFSAAFHKRRSATETLTVELAQGQWYVSGYFIR